MGYTGVEYSESFKQKLKQVLPEKDLRQISRDDTIYACIEDCYDSFVKIYEELLQDLDKASKIDVIGQTLIDLISEFQHIKEHILSAEELFWTLSHKIAEIEEQQEKGSRKPGEET